MTFGTRLRTAREQCDLSPEQVYDNIGLPVKSLSEYEADLTAPDPETVNELVKLYKVSPYFICGLSDVYAPLVSPVDMLDLTPLSEPNKLLVKEIFLALYKLDALGIK
ncbi:MAG: helix-turn-helix transcriptional regulator [Clostridia bacterium]|nr:helix-turn-helix transcriptional regulator [Clostridia bacterium]MBQ9878989.1 helix-turn-helix transcriptional regulator [Clostridia bacterium]